MGWQYRLNSVAAVLVVLAASMLACSDDSANNGDSADATDTYERDVEQDSADADDAEDADAPDPDTGDTSDATDTRDSDVTEDTADTRTPDIAEDTSDDAQEDVDTGPATTCGDGVVEGDENCDDGQITANCDTYHDGGDGTCVPADQCSDGYVLDENDACVPEQLDDHVHIYVTNTCQLSTDPTEIRVPRGQSVFVDWHNHSSDYEVDVWMSYGGGYTDLARGDTWDEPIEHCTNINRPYTEYADITISGLSLNDSSCPGHRLTIYCE